MNAHCTLEALSAFVDGELPAVEVRDVERHVADCPECRKELTQLRGVVARLRRLERLAPPPILADQLARRVALEVRSEGWTHHLEGRLRRWNAQSNILLTFALVLFFAVTVYFFTAAVEEHHRRTIPVRFVSSQGQEISGAKGELEEDRSGMTLTLTGRELVYHSGTWWPRGLADRDSSAVHWMTLDSQEWSQLLEMHGDLAPLADLVMGDVREANAADVALPAGAVAFWFESRLLGLRRGRE